MPSKLVNERVSGIDRQTFAERLRAAVEKGGGIPHVAKATDVPLSTFHTWLNGTAEPKITVTARIASFLGVSLDELVSGLESRSDNSGIQNIDSLQIPLLAVQAAAGAGVHNHDERVVSHLPFPTSLLRGIGVRPENCHFIRARGDSMEPSIPDGALVLIDTSRRKDRDDGIYAMMIGEDVRLKRLAFGTFGGVTVVSDNPAYPDETLGRADIDQVKIVGKAVWAGGVL